MGEVYSHLSEEERQVIQIEIGNGTSIRRIGLMLGRNASTVSREVKRNTWFPSNENESYRPYRPEGVPCRPPRAHAGRQGRQVESQGARIEGRPVRVGGDRALPEARIQRRGGADGDVPCGREHTRGGRHRPAAVGRADAIPDIERQTQEDLQGDRRVAETPVGIRVPVRVRGRRVAQAIPGRARGERGRPRRHRRRHGGPARGHRGRRGHARGRGRLGAVLPKHDRTRVEGRRTGGRRPVRRTRLHGQLDAAEREIPAVHGAFHARRAFQDARPVTGNGRRRP